MPMIGGRAAAAKFDPSQLSGQDRMMLLGATLRDMGSSLRGGDSEAVLNTKALMAGQQQMALQRSAQAKMMGLFGNGPQYQPGPDPSVAAPESVAVAAGGTPQSLAGLDDMSGALAGMTGRTAPPAAAAAPAQPWTPVQTSSGVASLSDPNTQRTLAAGAMAGVPGAKELLDILDRARPTVKVGPDGSTYDERSPASLGRHFANPIINNKQLIDGNDAANLNRYVPDAPVPGAIPVQDAAGHITDFRLPRGSAQAIGAAEAAKIGATEAAKLPYVEPTAAAEERGRAPYEFITAPGTDGAPTVMAKSQAAGGAFRGQSSAQTAADTARATAGASAEVGLPQSLSSATQALTLIDQLKAHPGRSDRTGAMAMFPAIPGTKGADFEAALSQLKGKVFLEAFAGLKGGGQITEVEGQKATEAIARLNQKQSPGGFLAALNDLQSVIKTGADRARSQATRLQATAATAGPPAQRQVGQVYQTPKGPMKWTQNGWVPQ